MSEKKTHVLFRISGGNSPSTELGFGHIYRAINLASQLKFYKIFFLVEDFGDAKRILRKYGFKNIIGLKKNISVKDDIKSTTYEINKKNINILIVDKFGPKLDNSYLRELKKKVKIVLITDLDKKQFPVDLLVSGFIGYDNKIIGNKYGSKCLLGPKYQILNNKYTNKKIKYKKKHILATFGGFDENNIAEFFMRACANFSSEIKIKIIQGSVRKKNTLPKISKNIEIISETKNMQKEISKAKFGFCSGGITTYEFAAMGIPFAIICQVKHQLKTAKHWEKKGIAINLGLFDKINRNKINQVLRDIMNENINLKTNKKNIIDGLGAKRVAHQISKLR